jgi:hypothetical protein
MAGRQGQKGLGYKMGLIYMATCKVNGKKYIGQTMRTMAERRREHEMPWNKSLFSRAIKKHGINAFDWRVLHSGILLVEELDRLEEMESKRHNAIAPGGYTLKTGGAGGHLSTATKKLLSKRMSECHKDPETSKRMLRGLVAFKLTQRWADVAQLLSSNNKARAKAVICVETGVVYESAREVARHHRCDSSNIPMACMNPKRTVAGYHWRYADESRHQEILVRHQEKELKKQASINKRMQERHSNILYARAERIANKDHQRTRHENYRAAAIKRHAIRKAKKEATQEWLDKQAAKKIWTERSRPKQIKCVETGEVFKSIKSAAKIIGVNQTTMSQAVRMVGRKCKGNHYEILKEA